MAGGTFANCDDCGRLTIHGQACVCAEVEERPCDCTHDGNQQHIGQGCAQRINDDWRDAMRYSRDLARDIARKAER